MSLAKWLEHQGWPHGFECIGIARMQHVWDAAQNEEREACEVIANSYGNTETEMAIRMRAKENR